MLKELFTIFGTIAINNKNANKALDETTDKGKQTASNLSKHFETAGKVFNNAGKLALSAGKTIIAATGGITAGLALAISRFDTLNNYPKVLSNLGFSAEDAKRSIDTLSNGIDGLPTALDDAASGVQRLVAKNRDIDKSTKYFLAMNDAIVAGNAPAEQQKSAIEQLTQAYSKGKPDLMEWRTLMMAMPGQLTQVAKAMGYVDTDHLYEALNKGKISMDKFMDAIVELDENGGEGIMSFQEQAHNACDSIGTSITNLSNRVKKGFATILGSMNEAAGNTSFGSIAGMINNFSTAVKNFLDKIGGALKTNKAFNDFLNQIANGLTKLNDTINNLSPEQLDKMVTAIVQLVKIGPGLLGAGEGLKLVGSAFNGLSKVAKPIDTINNKVFGFIANIDKMPGKVKGGLTKTVTSFTTFGGQVTSGLSTMFSGGIFDKIGNSVSKGFGKITSITSNGINKVLSPVKSLGGKVGNLLKPVKTVFDKAIVSTSLFSRLLKFNLSESLNGMFPNVSAGLSKITGAFGNAFSGILSKVGTFSKAFTPIFFKAFGIATIIGAVVAGLGLLQQNFGTQINEILTMVTEKGPQIITNFVNGIVSKIPELIQQGTNLLNQLLNAIIANLPAIIQGGAQILSALVIGIAQSLPTLIPTVVDLIMTIVNSLIENLPLIIEAGLQLLMGLVQGLVNAIPTLISWLPTIITTICNAITQMLPQIIQAGITILVTLIQGIVDAIPQLVQMLPQIITTIITVITENLPVIIDAGIQILIALIDGLIQAIPMLIEMLPQIITTIVTVLAQNLPKIIESGGKIITSLVAGIGALLGKLGEMAGKIGESIWNVIRELPGKALEWGKDIIQGMINGIKSMIGAIGNAVAGIGDKIKSFLHFSRPDEGPLREYEEWMPDMIKGLANTLEKSAPKLYNATKNLANNIANGLDFTKVLDNLNANVSGNIIWNDNPINTEPLAYSITQNDANRQNTSRINTLVRLLEYYLPLLLKASKKDIKINGKSLVGEILPIIDEELAL